MDKRLKTALEINNSSEDEFLNFCKKKNLNPNDYETKKEFFKVLIKDKVKEEK